MISEDHIKNSIFLADHHNSMYKKSRGKVKMNIWTTMNQN